MSKQRIKVGDIVKLKSGSPSMTVTQITDNFQCSLIWWDEKSGFAEANLLISSRVVADDNTEKLLGNPKEMICPRSEEEFWGEK